MSNTAHSIDTTASQLAVVSASAERLDRARAYAARMSDKPRLADLFGKPKKRRPFVTHDGTMIVQGESYPIAGVPITMDARPEPSGAAVTFDGAAPSSIPRTAADAPLR